MTKTIPIVAALALCAGAASAHTTDSKPWHIMKAVNFPMMVLDADHGYLTRDDCFTAGQRHAKATDPAEVWNYSACMAAVSRCVNLDEAEVTMLGPLIRQ